MAVKASATITITSIIDIQATYRYYLLQSSTLSKPSVPTTNPPGGSWDDAEPTYTSGSTNSLYYVDLTVFSDDSFQYSAVSLSTAYEAAKEAYNKAQNAQDTADNAQSDIDNLEVGGRNLLLNSKTLVGSNIGVNAGFVEGYNDFQAAGYDNSSATSGYVDILQFNGIKPEAYSEEYTLSFYAKGSGQMLTYFYGDTGYIKIVKSVKNDGTSRDWGEPGSDGNATWTLTDSWTRYWVTYTLSSTGDLTISKHVLFRVNYGNSASICGVKLERGNRVTDWTPAPEDINDATQDAVDKVQSELDETKETVKTAVANIDSINGMISMLVTGENGESLMTHTDTGWTFSMADILKNIDSANENIESLDSELNDATSTIKTLKQNVEDLGEYTEYIKFTIVDDQPAIILGETDSSFKVQITNTMIEFLEGTDIPAYISNQSLYIKKAVIEEELQQGGFVWKVETNNSYSLIWKGV